MLPRLQAEEQLAGVRIGALAAGTYPAEDRERLLADLDRRAAGTPPESSRAKKARPEDLATMGIGVTIAPPSQKAESDV